MRSHARLPAPSAALLPALHQSCWVAASAWTLVGAVLFLRLALGLRTCLYRGWPLESDAPRQGRMLLGRLCGGCLHYGFRGPFCQGPTMTLPGVCQPPWQSAFARLSLVEFARVLRAAGKTATKVLCQAHLP